LDKEKQAFDSASLDEQMDIVFDTLILRNLRQLKTRIEFESNPVGNWEKSVELSLLASPLFMHYETWLVEKCMRDGEYRRRISQKISELIKEIEDKQ
jgi:hypothetical protein